MEILYQHDISHGEVWGKKRNGLTKFELSIQLPSTKVRKIYLRDAAIV